MFRHFRLQIQLFKVNKGPFLRTTAAAAQGGHGVVRDGALVKNISACALPSWTPSRLWSANASPPVRLAFYALPCRSARMLWAGSREKRLVGTGKMLYRKRQHTRPPPRPPASRPLLHCLGIVAQQSTDATCVNLRFSSLRASTVLESAVEKLGILASLTTDIHNDELSSMLGNPQTAVRAKLTDCHTAAATAFSFIM